MSRMADASLGKIRITRSRRRISSFSRSCLFVERSRRRYGFGSAKTASASSNPSSRYATVFGPPLPHVTLLGPEGRDHKCQLAPIYPSG